MEHYLHYLTKGLIILGPFGLTALLCLASGYIVRAIPSLPNASIPFWTVVTGLLVGSLLLPFIAPLSAVPDSFRHPAVVLGAYGALIGVGTWLIHRLIGDKIEAKIRSKLPRVDDWFCNTSDANRNTNNTKENDES